MRQPRIRLGAAGLLVVFWAMLALPVAVQADVVPVKAIFLGPGTYATADGCKKLAALVNGTERNISTVPEVLTEDGFESWEGGCTFISVKEVEQDKKWETQMHCSEGAEEGPEAEIFERAGDSKFKVTVGSDVTIFERCDAE